MGEEKKYSRIKVRKLRELMEGQHKEEGKIGRRRVW